MARPFFLYTLFFLSGCSALVYEAAWSRLIGLVIGHTAQGAAVVLAAYFLGLAIGQAVGGLIAQRQSPLLWYGAAEIFAAGWACVIPLLLDRVSGASGPGEAMWCCLILLPATIPLGATLPLMVEALQSGSNSRSSGALAYGLNTAGGLVGIIAASACLLVVVGVRGSNSLAAGLSALCGAAACFLSWIDRRQDSVRLQNSDIERPRIERVEVSFEWLVLSAISGFGTLGLEILYTRLFSLLFHNSTYTFGIVVAVFLLGLSLGAPLAVGLARRFSPRQIAAAAFWLGGLALAVSMAAFPWITGLHYFSSGDSFAGYLLGALGLVTAFVLPPVTLLGMSLPAAIQALPDGRAVGRITAVNTLAGAAGAVVAGFVLLPGLGLWSACGAIVALFVIAGAVLLGRPPPVATVAETVGDRPDHVPAIQTRPRRIRQVAIALLTVTAVVFGSGLIAPAPEGGDGQVIHRFESAYGWIDVVRKTKSRRLAVRQNLHYQLGSTGNSIGGCRLGRLPLLLHPRPADAAYLGLGTGLTAAPAVVDPAVERAVVIELIPEVVTAARMLAESNLNLVDDPKVKIEIDDARHRLQRTARQFDVIVSDLLVPWESRAGYLFTVEFYASLKRRLKPYGLYCQWLPLYQLGPQDLDLIADSFSSVFPNTTVWWGQFDPDYPIIALIGSEEVPVIDLIQRERRSGAFNPLPGGSDPELSNPTDLPGLYLGRWLSDRSRPLNTDEHPWLEFTAPISHKSKRTLRGKQMRAYFDRVLTPLPSGGIRFVGDLSDIDRDDARRRAVQKLSLFGAE